MAIVIITYDLLLIVQPTLYEDDYIVIQKLGL